MYSISKLCKEFNLSRSTLLYYDAIDLLKPADRTNANYRVYSDSDRTRLEQICLYREAGVSLEQIKELLDSRVKSEETILQKRLYEINNELYLLRLQQKILVGMLKSKNCNDSPMMDDRTFVDIMRASGINDDSFANLHIEFERRAPEEHQIFLEFLGMDEEKIKYIRESSKAGLKI